MKVRNMVKRLFAVGTGVAMLGATAMGALAADLGNYPDMFVKDGVFDGYFVVGENAASVDNIALTDISAGMKYTAAGETSTVSVEGDVYQFTSGTETLELGEDIFDVRSFLDSENLAALGGGSGSTVKGDFAYKEYLRFFPNNTMAVFEQADDDAELTDVYLKISDDAIIAQYEMDFTKSLDAEDETNALTDLDDKTLTLMGVEYNIVSGVNNTVKLTLMAGSVRETLNEGESKTYALEGTEYEVTLSSISGAAGSEVAKFVVNGEATPAVADGDTYKLESGVELGVSDITYQSYAGGIHAAQFYLGADKVVLEDGSTVEVNSESIDGSLVQFTTTATSSELQIENIKINMTAQDDYWIPAGGKLSENTNLDEAELLFTENWDFQFGGLKEEVSNEVMLDSVGSDEGYKLKFTNVAGIEINAPLAYEGTTKPDGTNEVDGHFGAKNEILHITAPSTTDPIVEDEWFILNTGTDKTSESYVLQYKGRDANTTTDPEVSLNILGVGIEGISVNTLTHVSTLNLGGKEFTLTTADGTKDSNITVIAGGGPDYNSLYTQYGVRVDLLSFSKGIPLDARNSSDIDGGALVYLGNATMAALDMQVTFDTVDSDRLDDAGLGEFASYNFTRTDSSEEIDLNAIREDVYGASMLENDANENIVDGFNVTGIFISRDNGESDASSEVTMTVPETQREALVYVTSGATASTTSADGTLTSVNTVDATKLDSEVADITMQNLIVVGGPCVNSVAAELMGNPANCADGFTPGKARVKLFENGDYMAMLVAGYSGADTRLAGSVIAHRAADLTGMEVEVEGTSYATATIGAPTVMEEVVEVMVDEPVVDEPVVDDTTTE
jgi:hypothetical protein